MLEDSSFLQDSGSAYVFRRNVDVWEQEAKLTVQDGVEYERFGSRPSVQPSFMPSNYDHTYILWYIISYLYIYIIYLWYELGNWMELAQDAVHMPYA